MCPSHYSELFRRYIKLISPSTIWTKVLSFTPFLLPFFHFTSQTRCLQCFCGSLLSRVLTPTYLWDLRKSCRVSTGVSSACPRWSLRCFIFAHWILKEIRSRDPRDPEGLVNLQGILNGLHFTSWNNQKPLIFFHSWSLVISFSYFATCCTMSCSRAEASDYFHYGFIYWIFSWLIIWSVKCLKAVWKIYPTMTMLIRHTGRNRNTVNY